MMISRESNKIMENQLKELKEIAPNIGDDILNEILKENNYDIEKSIDSTLALIISLSNDNDQKKAINSRTTSNIYDSEVYYRGAPMYLPNTFLCCPVFRSAIDNVTLNSIDFTVYLRRERRSLGIVFGLTNGEISVSSLPSRSLDMNELSFASLAGIKVGDILKGLDSEYFCPGAEVQDINDIIHYSDRYLKLHFSRRKKSNNLIFENQNENHKYTQMMIEQNVISPSIASNVNTMLTRLRDRALRWDHKTVSERINTLKIREFPQKNLSPLQSTVSISNRLSFNLRSSQRIASSSSSNRPLTISPMSDNGQFSSSFNGSDDASTSTLRSRLRPALSVQVLHTEQLDDYTSYVLWICDVLSGVEWKVSKRFSEFYQFRQVLIEIRSTVSKFDFPSKTFGAVETATTIARRMDLFQKFMRKVIYLTCINTLHPSTIKLQLAVQGFLEVYSKFGLMEIYEGQKIAQTVTNSVQVYIHSVAHLPIMDKVFAGYVNNFYDLCSQSTASWTSAKLKTESCRHLLDGVRDFMDSLQEILCETLWEDCLQISTRILRKVRIVKPTSSIAEVKSDDIFDENKLEPPQPIYTRTPAKDYEHIIHKESLVDNNLYRTLSSELNSRTKTISSIDKGEVELKSFTEDRNRPSTPPLHDVFFPKSD